eukprot:501859-Pelagomonas_calceolata.AAC.5
MGTVHPSWSTRMDAMLEGHRTKVVSCSKRKRSEAMVSPEHGGCMKDIVVTTATNTITQRRVGRGKGRGRDRWGTKASKPREASTFSEDVPEVPQF